MTLHGFISSDHSARKAYIQDELEWARLDNRPSFIFFSDSYDRETALFAPGKKNSVKIDVLYELFASTSSIRDFATQASSALIVESLTPQGDTENYWGTSARLVAKGLLPVAVRSWALLRGHQKRDRNLPSLSGLFLSLVDELMAAKGKRNWADPQWWDLLDDRDERSLRGLIVNNAPTTAGCIFAELNASLGALRETTCETKTPLLPPRFALSVEHSALTTRALHLICSLAAKKGALVIADDLMEWDVQKRKILGSCAPSGLDLAWTAHVAPPEEFCSGGLGFGASSNAATLDAFTRKVAATTGLTSGRLIHLPRERPSELNPDEVIWYHDDWIVTDLPQAAPREYVRPEPAASEIDDYLALFEKGTPLPVGLRDNRTPEMELLADFDDDITFM